MLSFLWEHCRQLHAIELQQRDWLRLAGCSKWRPPETLTSFSPKEKFDEFHRHYLYHI